MNTYQRERNEILRQLRADPENPELLRALRICVRARRVHTDALKRIGVKVP